MKEMNITLKREIDFSNAQVGDDVFCLLRGPGKIEKIVVCAIHPIRVAFINNRHNTYLFSGHDINEHNEYASLYFFNPETREVLYEHPEPEIDWAEYEEKEIEVKDIKDIDDDSHWRLRTLCKYAPKFSKSFLCYSLDKRTIVSWGQARLVKEDS